MIDAPFADRIRSAGRAGFAGIGVGGDDLDRAHADGVSDADLRSLLADEGVEVVEIEALWGWDLDPEERAPKGPTEDDLYRIADSIGGRHVVIVGHIDESRFACSDDREAVLDQAAAQLAACADRAASHGLVLAMEVHSRLSINQLGDAWDVIRRAERPNCGVLLDTWHYFRVRRDLGGLDDLPAERIFGLQVVDGADQIVESLAEDKVHRGRLPGEGDFDLDGLFEKLIEMDVAGPVVVETTSDELSALTSDDRARRAYQALSGFVAMVESRATG
jgi:sugar phosphate isomerase/epimerase